MKKNKFILVAILCTMLLGFSYSNFVYERYIGSGQLLDAKLFPEEKGFYLTLRQRGNDNFLTVFGKDREIISVREVPINDVPATVIWFICNNRITVVTGENDPVAGEVYQYEFAFNFSVNQCDNIPIQIYIPLIKQ